MKRSAQRHHRRHVVAAGAAGQAHAVAVHHRQQLGAIETLDDVVVGCR
jgi:hypothetical protein